MSDDAAPNDAAQAARDIFEYKLTPSTLKEILGFLMSNRTSEGKPKEMAAVMIWGAMGIGKSQIVQQVADQWGYRTVALHLPQFDPTDIKGVPVFFPAEGDRPAMVKWVASSYLPQAMTLKGADLNVKDSVAEINFSFPAAIDVKLVVRDEKGVEIARVNDGRQPDHDDKGIISKFQVVNPRNAVLVRLSSSADYKKYSFYLEDKAVLFLDELSASAPETMNAALQLVLDRRVGEYDVPEEVPVVAAGNRESDAAFVNPMPAPLANRFTHIRLDIDTDEWVEWAIEHAVNPEIIGYLKWKGSGALMKFVQSEQIEGDLGFPTPRSWAKLGAQLDNAMSEKAAEALICGYIGKKRGHEFIQYRKTCTLLPSTDDILQGKEVRMPDDTDTGAKYSLAIALCFKLQDYYRKWYDENIPVERVDDQPSQWKIATESMTSFIHDQLGPEMTVLCIHIITRHLKISFTKFTGEKYKEFAERYRLTIRKMVVN